MGGQEGTGRGKHYLGAYLAQRLSGRRLVPSLFGRFHLAHARVPCSCQTYTHTPAHQLGRYAHSSRKLAQRRSHTRANSRTRERAPGSHLAMLAGSARPAAHPTESPLRSRAGGHRSQPFDTRPSFSPPVARSPTRSRPRAVPVVPELAADSTARPVRRSSLNNYLHNIIIFNICTVAAAPAGFLAVIFRSFQMLLSRSYIIVFV